MKKTVYLMILPVALLIASCKTIHPAGIYEKAPEVSQNQPTPVISSPTVSSSPTTTTSSTPAPANPVATTQEDVRKESFTLASTETNQNPINMKYNVVVGSFENQSNAQRLSATLKAEGKDPAVVVNQKGMFRVIISSYNDYAQATQVKLSLQSRFPGAWLLVQDNH
jgi:cell division protein FtsN